MALLQAAGIIFAFLFLAAVLVIGITVVFFDDIYAMAQQLSWPGAAATAAAEPLPPAMAGYLALKNRSCDALSGNFLMVTEESSYAEAEGAIPDTPEMRTAVALVTADYLFNATTKTYVRGGMMKIVNVTPQENTTKIWKDGRLYECGRSCTMHLLSDGESAELARRLAAIRTSCAYFGKTPLPAHADAAKLFTVSNVGKAEFSGRRCTCFYITANSSYASSLLESGNLSDGQRTLLWGAAHFHGPVRECLDEGNGMTVLREVSLDLTDAYRFTYSPGGYMRASQQYRLAYFTYDVPESFFSLPKEDGSS